MLIANKLTNKKLNPVINFSHVFITQSYFAVQKNIARNSTHYILKTPNKRELNKLHLIIHHILNLFRLYKFCKRGNAKLYSFLVTDATLASDNPSRFRKNLLE